jgi:RimJ/RimL family protein N-acetyltransferase
VEALLFATAGVRLRTFTQADAQLIFDLDSDPEVMRYLSGGPGTPLDEIQSRVLPRFLAVDPPTGQPGYWAAEDSASSLFLGWFALHSDAEPGVFSLGFRLHRQSWGRGIATQVSRELLRIAFTQFQATCVTAQTYEDNRASRRVLEKLGMRHVRSFHIADAAELAPTFTATAELFPGDDVEYAITREEWLSSRPR